MSPRLTVNMGEAQSFENVPVGTYPVVVKEFSEVQNGERASYTTVQVEITDGDHRGRRLWSNLPLEGRGAGIFQSFWKAATGNELELGVDNGIDVDTDEAIGADLQVVIKEEEYPEGSGEMRSQIKRWLPAGAQPKEGKARTPVAAQASAGRAPTRRRRR